jgi:hypothetical protein
MAYVLAIARIGHYRRGGAAPMLFCFLLPFMNQTQPDRSKTQVQFLRELISLHKFIVVNKGEQIAEGYIVQVISAEVAIVDLWRDGDKNKTTTHYLQFKEMTWNEYTQTGYVFGPLPEPA